MTQPTYGSLDANGNYVHPHANDPFMQQMKAEQERMIAKLRDDDIGIDEYKEYAMQATADSKAYLKQKRDAERGRWGGPQKKAKENSLGMTKEQFKQEIANADDPIAKRKELLNQLRGGPSEKMLENREARQAKRAEAKERAQNATAQSEANAYKGFVDDYNLNLGGAGTSIFGRS